jgi:hypothetical protein
MKKKTCPCTRFIRRDVRVGCNEAPDRTCDMACRGLLRVAFHDTEPRVMPAARHRAPSSHGGVQSARSQPWRAFCPHLLVPASLGQYPTWPGSGLKVPGSGVTGWAAPGCWIRPKYPPRMLADQRTTRKGVSREVCHRALIADTLPHRWPHQDWSRTVFASLSWVILKKGVQRNVLASLNRTPVPLAESTVSAH